MRVVSLVPSLTETLAALDMADCLVAVTRYCMQGAPAACPRIGGTKNPDVPAVVELAPDLVLANAEENRIEDLEALRRAGLNVHVTFPRRVADVGPLLADVAALVGAPVAARDRLLSDLAAAEADAAACRPQQPVSTLTLVWRKPWMGAGPDTYVDDLLSICGLANVLADASDRYPRLGAAPVPPPRVVLLPSEPYAFTVGDLPALRAWLGGKFAYRFVDGELLTWHGPRTAAALRVFSRLAAELSG